MSAINHKLSHTIRITKYDDSMSATHVLSCCVQSLVGLARCDTVKQIISKLPLFTDGQLQRMYTCMFTIQSLCLNAALYAMTQPQCAGKLYTTHYDHCQLTTH